MGGRSIIQAAVKEERFTMKRLSLEGGMTHAYIQQFLTRHVPRELPEEVREKLAPLLGVPPDALREGPRADRALKTSVASQDSQMTPAESEEAILEFWRALGPRGRDLALGIMETIADVLGKESA